VEDEGDAVAIGDFAEDGGAEAGHGADFAGNQLLRANENGGEGGGQMKTGDRARTANVSGNRELPARGRNSTA
jgi:hypothetical protein